MTDYSTAIITSCPWCKTRFVREDGPLCDCLQEHCEHSWHWENHNGKGWDFDEGNTIKVKIYCSKCFMEAYEIYQFAGKEDSWGNPIE